MCATSSSRAARGSSSPSRATSCSCRGWASTPPRKRSMWIIMGRSSGYRKVSPRIRVAILCCAAATFGHICLYMLPQVFLARLVLLASPSRNGLRVHAFLALVETTPALQRLGKYQPACPAALFLLFPKISQCFRTLRFSGALFAAECRDFEGQPPLLRDGVFPSACDDSGLRIIEIARIHPFS